MWLIRLALWLVKILNVTSMCIKPALGKVNHVDLSRVHLCSRKFVTKTDLTDKIISFALKMKMCHQAPNHFCWGPATHTKIQKYPTKQITLLTHKNCLKRVQKILLSIAWPCTYSVIIMFTYEQLFLSRERVAFNCFVRANVYEDICFIFPPLFFLKLVHWEDLSDWRNCLWQQKKT